MTPGCNVSFHLLLKSLSTFCQ